MKLTKSNNKANSKLPNFNSIDEIKSYIKPEKNHQQHGEMGFFKSTILALIVAGIMRSFFFEPFHIPSSSMKPNLLIGDYIFVSKFSYGYSRYSFPFGLNFFSGRILKNSPKRGDVVVFRLPSDPSINYVKRLIGLPGDRIQMRKGVLFVNEKRVKKLSDGEFIDFENGKELVYQQFLEKFPKEIAEEKIGAEVKEKEVLTLDLGERSEDETGIYKVPLGHYFFMGDNRDNSQDSRFLNKVGYVPEENLIGKASLIFLSVEKPIWQIWNWGNSIRFKRIFQPVR